MNDIERLAEEIKTATLNTEALAWDADGVDEKLAGFLDSAVLALQDAAARAEVIS